MSSTNHLWGRTFRSGGRSRASTIQAQGSERDVLEEWRRSQELETLARALSHHFNEELHIIGGHAELIAGDLSRTQTRASADVIRSAVGRMERTFKDVILSALSGHAKLSRVDVAAHLVGLRAALEELAPGRVELHIEAEQPVQALANETLLTESLVHLVKNSNEALPQNPARICIRCAQIELGYEDLLSARPISNVCPGSYARIEVHDEGRAIAGTDLERIFDPPFTGQLVGRGLDLHSVLCNMQRMGGLITLQSSSRKGTIICLLLQTGGASKPERHGDDLPLSAFFAGC